MSEKVEELSDQPEKLSQTFLEGVDAYKAGADMDDCPYPPRAEGVNGSSRTDWLNGLLFSWRVSKHGPLVWASENGKETIDETMLAQKLGLSQGNCHRRRSVEIEL